MDGEVDGWRSQCIEKANGWRSHYIRDQMNRGANALEKQIEKRMDGEADRERSRWIKGEPMEKKG
jgi:hypothetical protein